MITDENAPELRIKNPTAEEYIYVANLAKSGMRSLPNQLKVIIKEHKELSYKDGLNQIANLKVE